MSLVTVLLFGAGIVLLIWGADLLVRGASHLAALAGISPLVIGLTVVALGTSAPELAVFLQDHEVKDDPPGCVGVVCSRACGSSR